MATSEDRSINSAPPLWSSYAALWRVARVTFAAEPLRTFILAVAQVGQQVANLVVVAAAAALTDAVAQNHVNGRVIGALVGAAVVSQGFGWTAVVMGSAMRERVTHVMEQRILELLGTIDTIDHTERADFQNEMGLLRWQAIWLAGIANRLIDTITGAGQLLAIAWLLSRVHPSLVGLLLAATPAVVVSRHQQRLRHRTRDRLEQPRRKRAVYRRGHHAEVGEGSSGVQPSAGRPVGL